MKKIGAYVAHYFRTTDKWLMLMWLLASSLSVLFLYGLFLSEYANFGRIRTQVAATGLGLTAAIIMSTIDYHTLLKLWKFYMPVVALVNLLPFVPSLGTIRGDNQAWINVPIGGGISVQPSELLKIVFITTLALHISKVKDEINRLPVLFFLCLHGGAYVLLIQLQGDSGSALIFLGIFLVMLFCAGIHWRYIGIALVAALAAAPLLWFRIMSDDQRMRILTLFNPELNDGYAWQQAQSISALGYGGMRGTGILEGKHIYVAEIYNDFIFSFIGNSAGFIGCLGVIALLLAIAFKVLFNSRMAPDDEGKFLCIGVFAMIVLQMIINIGMCISVLPVIGVTLPLFSAGGTSILSMYLGLGLVLSVYGHSKTSLFYG